MGYKKLAPINIVFTVQVDVFFWTSKVDFSSDIEARNINYVPDKPFNLFSAKLEAQNIYYVPDKRFTLFLGNLKIENMVLTKLV